MNASEQPQPPREDYDNTGVGPDGGSAAGTPRWIKVAGIVIGILVVLMFVVLHLTGAAGPGAH